MGMRFDGSSDDEHNMYDDLFYNLSLNAAGQKPKNKDQNPRQSLIFRKFREWLKRGSREESSEEKYRMRRKLMRHRIDAVFDIDDRR